MEAGGFDLDLRPDTPKSVLDAITYFGGLTVTPVHLPYPEDVTESTLRSVALYTGVITGLANDRRTIEGYGPAYLLGTSGGLSDTYEADQTPGALDLETWIKAKVLTDSSDNLNGIFPGAIVTGTASVAGVITKGSTPIDVLNWVVTDLYGGDYSWKINPDLTLDVDHYTVIGSNRLTVFSNFDGGDGMLRTGIVDAGQQVGFRCRFTEDHDVEDWTSRVVVEDTSGGTGSAANGESYLPITSGSAIERTRFYDSSRTTTGNAATAAAGILAQYATTRSQVSVEVFDSYAPTAQFAVGDGVEYHNRENPPTAGFETYYRGQVLLTDYGRVTSVEWPLQRGMGVYAGSSASASILDLTEWVVWENTNPVVRIGANPRPLTVVEQPGTRH